MKIAFDCYVTARVHRGSDTPLDAAQLRAAGLDGMDDPDVSIAPYLDDPLIADEGLVDAGVRYWIDPQGELRAALSFRCIPRLSEEQLKAISDGLVGQLLDGWGEGRLLDTASDAVWFEWFEHRGGDDRIFRIEQTDDGEPVADLRTPIAIKAVVKGDVGALQSALDAGADLNARNREGMTALMVAAFEGRESCVDLLLVRGADPNFGHMALRYAATSGHAGIVRKLLAAGADPSPAGDKAALLWAVGREHEDVVRILLEAGADTSVVDENGATAIFLTSKPAMIRLLVEAGMDLRTRNADGQTPLEHALDQADAMKRIKWRDGEKEWRAAAKELRRLGKG